MDDRVQDAVHGRIAEVEIDVSAIKQSVLGLTGALERIEAKLEAPSGQPTWVSIGSFVVVVVSLMASVVLAFVGTMTIPLAERIVRFEQDMAIEVSDKQAHIRDMALLEAGLERLKVDQERTVGFLEREYALEMDTLRQQLFDAEQQELKSHKH